MAALPVGRSAGSTAQWRTLVVFASLLTLGGGTLVAFPLYLGGQSTVVVLSAYVLVFLTLAFLFGGVLGGWYLWSEAGVFD